MSGHKKFNENQPKASICIEFDPDKGKITHNYSLKSVDDADVQKLSSLYKFYASFKSSGGSSPYMATRGNIVDTPAKVLAHTKKILNMGESLEEGTHLTFKAIMNEALTMNEYGRKMLHENSIEQLDEFALLDKIKKEIKFNLEIRRSWVKWSNGKENQMNWHSHYPSQPVWAVAVYYIKTLPFFNSGTLFEDGFVRAPQNSMIIFPAHLLHTTPKYPFPFVDRYVMSIDLS